MCHVFGCPAIENEADWEEDDDGDEERDAEFGEADIVVACFEFDVDFVLDWGGYLGWYVSNFLCLGEKCPQEQVRTWIPTVNPTPSEM